MAKGQETAETVRSESNIRVERYDVTRLRELTHWDVLSTGLRQAVLNILPPTETAHSSNVTTIGLHEYLPLALSLGPASAGQLDPPAELAFGDSQASFSAGDTSLNNEVGSRIDITDLSASGDTLNYDEYVSAVEQNGNTLAEIGAFSADGQMYQHAPLSQTYEKDNTFELIINGTFTFSDA